MNDAKGQGPPFRELFDRATRAATAEECDSCVAEIEALLETTAEPADRGRLLLCRARVRSNQWRTGAVFEDTREAMRLFEMAGEGDLVVDAASWAAAHASRIGELSVAADLATRSLLALESVDDERLRLEIWNRLGIFCVSFLDYDRAVDQFERSLAAAERLGDPDKIARQLHNVADGLLLAIRQRKIAGAESRPGDLVRAEAVVRELLERSSPEFTRRAACYRLLAEVLCERGEPEEGLAVLDQYRGQTAWIAAAAQRAAVAWIEARCLRLAGRPQEAVARARTAVEIARDSTDDHEIMVALEELSACQEAAGELAAGLATAREVKNVLWTIHQRETTQLVREVWARADFVKDQMTLQTQAEEARRRAEEDALTGIGNRRILDAFLEHAAGDARSLAMIVIDLDRFKAVNDGYGHQLGDAVLRRIGHLLRDEARPDQIPVRYGGDEFVIAALGIELEAASGFAERLRRRIDGLDWESLAPGLNVTASFGVAAGRNAGWRAVLVAADEALYAAKRDGGNRLVVAPASPEG